MKVVIVGGVAGGATAAARLRRLDESAEILILERSGFVSYANCGLPYYIGGVIEEDRALTLKTPESFWERFRIEVRTLNEVVAIDRAAKSLRVRRLEDGSEYTESYDKLLLSPGARPVRPRLPGIEDERVVTLRTVEDAQRIRSALEARAPRSAVVVGGGFVGLEAAENLMARGIETTLVEMDRQVLQPLDYDMACEVHAYLRRQGLSLRLGAAVTGFEPQGERLLTRLEGGEALEADLVLLAIGVTPDTRLAREAGLALGIKGAMVVDERMRTSDEHIYAVGDAVEVRHLVTGQQALVSLAGPANKQGRIAADNIAGLNSRFQGAQGSSVLKLFEMTAAATGVNERAAQAAGLPFDKVVVYSASHATYYPGAANLTIKALFEPESGRILGAQVVGFGGVDKRLDVLATAIRGGMTAADLAELELGYAPPYGSAKDPINMVGFAIENVRSGLVRQWHWHQLEQLPKDGSVTLLDVRAPHEYRGGHIPSARNIPLDQLRERLGELDRSKPVYVNCFSGLRSYLACRILSQHGFECYNLSGGYRFYEFIASACRHDPAPTHPCGIQIER